MRFAIAILGLVCLFVEVTGTKQAATECVKPWAIPDKWEEMQTPAWDRTDTFDRYVTSGSQSGSVILNPDMYAAPSINGPGTGFRLPDDYGIQLMLKLGDGTLSPQSGWFYAVDLAGASGGANAYRDVIAGCATETVTIGNSLSLLTGSLHGPTIQGVAYLIARDPNASWDSSSGTIVNSCAPGICADGQYYARSPRIGAIAVFNPDAFQQAQAQGQAHSVVVTNVFGFFIEGIENRNVMGRLVTVPSMLVP